MTKKEYLVAVKYEDGAEIISFKTDANRKNFIDAVMEKFPDAELALSEKEVE